MSDFIFNDYLAVIWQKRKLEHGILKRGIHKEKIERVYSSADA